MLGDFTEPVTYIFYNTRRMALLCNIFDCPVPVRLQTEDIPKNLATKADVIYLAVDPDSRPKTSDLTGEKPYEMMKKLEHSIGSLLALQTGRQCYVYSYTLDGSENQELETMLAPSGVKVVHCGKLELETSDQSQSKQQNAKRDVLGKKIEILARHSGDAVLVDLDTTWVSDLNLDAPTVWNREYKLNSGKRGLNAFWDRTGVVVPKEHHMLNTGVVYIPPNDKQEVLSNATAFYNKMGEHPGKGRHSSVLDEQISLSYAMQQKYGDNLKFAESHIKHHFHFGNMKSYTITLQ